MKKYLTIAVMALTSCTGNEDKKAASSDTARQDPAGAPAVNEPAQNREYCFLLTEGAASKDTTTIHLVLNGGKVSGEMKWTPYEKDSRKGTLAGTVAGDEIKAVWSFMQEGVIDSINVAFKMSPQQLAQKPLKVNTTNGREETDNATGYTRLYKPVDCGQSK